MTSGNGLPLQFGFSSVGCRFSCHYFLIAEYGSAPCGTSTSLIPEPLTGALSQRRHSCFGFSGRGFQPASLFSKCSLGAEMRNQCPRLTERLSVRQRDTCAVRSFVLV